MKPIIGVILRKSKSETGKNILLSYEAINYSIQKSGGIPIGIEPEAEYINICDGFIFQGGDDCCDEDLNFMSNILNKNMPILGICLGMQELGVLFNGKIIKANNHHSNLNNAHKVYINNKSKLYKIINKDEINVNSRHHDRLIDTNLFVSAISGDGVIEAVELPNYKFCIGLQWHPENLIDFDIPSMLLFKSFINSCKERYNEFK